MNPVRSTPPERPEPVQGLARPSPLAALNAHIAQASQAAAEGEPANGSPWPELRSARRFRETWERMAAEVQVQQAHDRAPPNAGPLNPQRLMLETLARMGELSPHYLRRFLAHAQTLLWLEQAQGLLRPSAGGKGGAARPAKAARRKA